MSNFYRRSSKNQCTWHHGINDGTKLYCLFFVVKLKLNNFFIKYSLKEKQNTGNKETEAALYDEVDSLPHDLRYSNFDLLCTVISILTYLFDLAMDVTVASYFYHLVT